MRLKHVEFRKTGWTFDREHAGLDRRFIEFKAAPCPHEYPVERFVLDCRTAIQPSIGGDDVRRLTDRVTRNRPLAALGSHYHIDVTGLGDRPAESAPNAKPGLHDLSQG